MLKTCTVRPVAQAGEAAVALLTWWLDAAPRTPLLPPPAGLDPGAAARSALARSLRGDPRVSAWVALDPAGRAVALLAVSLEVTDEDHPAYTYMPRRYAYAPLGSTALAGPEHADLLVELVRHVAVDARRLGIEQLLVQTRPQDWVVQSVLRQLGLRPAIVTAARRTVSLPGVETVVRPAVRVREARPEDRDELVTLALQEHEYHAAHTDLGVPAGQPVAPTARVVHQWLEPGAGARALVGEDVAGVPLGCLSLYLVDLPPVHPAAFGFPARYGYIGLTCVTERSRGQGVGRALVDAALRDLSVLGVGEVLLDYVEGNEPARRFWGARGFAPHVVTLGGDVLGRDR